MDTLGQLVDGDRARILVEPLPDDILGDLVDRQELLGEFGLRRLQGVGEVGGFVERPDPLDGLGPQLLVVLIEVAPYIFRFRRTSGAGNGSEEAPGLVEEVSRTVSHTGTGKLSGWQLSARVALKRFSKRPCTTWGGRGTSARVHDHAPCGRWQTSTFLAAWRVTGLTAPGVFDGAIDGESFRAYIEQILVPTLQPGDIVIADTLGAHKVAGIQRAIQAAGATLWYLPPYSPDLNPIELCFAKLKALVRTARCRRTETLWPFLGECLAHFSPDECRNYFRHCGYSAATRS